MLSLHSSPSARRIAAIGTFDGVHRGHQAVADFLVSEGQARGLVPAVVTFSRHPLEVVRPGYVPSSLCTLPEKCSRLRQAGVHDVIVLDFDEKLRRLSARDFLSMLHDDYGVDAVVLGFNNRFGSDRLSELDDYVRVAATLGMEVIRAPRYQHPGFGEVSSTAIRSLVSSGDVVTASELLGHPFIVSGKVVGGKRIGRTLGFPTANLDVSASCAVPAEGVYAARVHIASLPTLEGRTAPATYPAMVNVGRRPTVDESASPALSVEAHLIGFDGDLYGATLDVEFVRRLRSERKFDSLDSLVSQLRADRAAVQAALQSPAPR